MTARDEWVQCVARPDGESYCGNAEYRYLWRFVSLEHALAAIAKSAREKPCEACMVAANAEVES